VLAVDSQAWGILPADAQHKTLAVDSDAIVCIRQTGDALDLQVFHTGPTGYTSKYGCQLIIHCYRLNHILFYKYRHDTQEGFMTTKHTRIGEIAY
jgi:hypothetical protein